MVWTCSLVKLEHNYTGISAHCHTNHIAQQSKCVNAITACSFWSPRPKLLVTDNVIITVSLLLTSFPLSNNNLHEGINMLWSKPLSFGHNLHRPDGIIYSDLRCVCTGVCATKVSFQQTCTLLPDFIPRLLSRPKIPYSGKTFKGERMPHPKS